MNSRAHTTFEVAATEGYDTRMPLVPPGRLRLLNDAPTNNRGHYVLYWMVAFRRTRSNFALQHAITLAQQHRKPLLVLEALRVGYRWASDRHHRFVLQGMADNERAFAKTPITYYPYVEPQPDADKGLLQTLAEHACEVVTDDFPCFFLPKMQASAAKKLTVRLCAVDSNGLYPMRATERVFTTAHSFRVHLQKELKPHLYELPEPEPLARLQLPQLAALPKGVRERWPKASAALLRADAAALGQLPIDHHVGPAAMSGGSETAQAKLDAFISKRLADYPDARNEPSVDGTSGLSPYLHFGHVSTHEVLAAIARRERWSPDVLGKSIGGTKAGWWQLSPAAEAFIDELVTWRELAFNMSSHRDDYADIASLPAWAKATHREHAKDPRPHQYTLDELERAHTHDELWNAAQRQMVRDGWFHNYLRMLWGKKILEWSTGPQAALDTMEQLMGKYSLDGRNPCSYSGYFWVLGRYDRAWGPERPIFGKVRYMSSENTARKLNVKPYLSRYAP